MQGNIEQAFMLTSVGNAFLQGRDIKGFWPDARTFAWTKLCEFRLPPPSGRDADEYPLKAADPPAWFASLKSWARGLRLHAVPPDMDPYNAVGASPRMLVGFVGGGPRWLVEAVGETSSELWQGFDRLGDRNDPKRKIWLTTWIEQGEIAPGVLPPVTLDEALEAMRLVLPRIEAFARRQAYDPFAECFARAIAALDGDPDAGEPPNESETLRFTTLTPDALRVRTAISHAWVFGGMGSWNDIGGAGEEYDQLSEELFSALTNAVCGLANSTFRG